MELEASQNGLQNLARHIASLQQRITENEVRVETTNDRLMELAKASKERFDRMQSLVSTLDAQYRKNTEELRLDMAELNGRLTQNRVLDTKMKELLTKHNDMVSKFELRLQELKKALNSHEMKILEHDSYLKGR